MLLKGSCLCGNVKIELTGEPKYQVSYLLRPKRLRG
jgi:hypothetical protein